MLLENASQEIKKLSFVLLFVLMIAGLVIKATQETVDQVTDNTQNLLTIHVPHLTVINDLQNIINTLNLNLHSNYAKPDQDYLEKNKTLIAEFKRKINTTTFLNEQAAAVTAILNALEKFEKTATYFDKEMRNDFDRNLDKIRSYLYEAQTYSESITNELSIVSSEIRAQLRSESNSADQYVSRLNQNQLLLVYAIILVSLYILYIAYLRNKDQKRLYDYAFIDQLTGLPNRRYFLEKYEHINNSSSSSNFTLLMPGLDRFNLITGSFGHETGDRIIQSVTDWLHRSLLEQKINYELYQFTEKSWLVVLPDIIDPSEAQLVSEKLMLISTKPVKFAKREISSSISIGICNYADDVSDINTLLRSAETALKDASQHGGNRFTFYNEKMYLQTVENIDIESALRHAINRNQLSIFWQPKYMAQTAEVYGAEALLRWSVDDAFISPAKFIPLAEKSGLIMALGGWVLEESCKQWMAWQAHGLPAKPIAVNVSAQQFQDPGFPKQVETILQETGMPANMLELEITEEAAADNPQRIIKTMQRLGDMGLSLALDDFGTGYSSLSNLNQFPIHTIKIDQSFVKTMADSSANLFIVEIILGLSKQLNCRTVAEGVETKEQYEHLKQLDCDYIQGYLFSKPLCQEDYKVLLGRSMGSTKEKSIA